MLGDKTTWHHGERWTVMPSPKGWRLTENSSGATWMDLSKFEIDTQARHMAAAYGRVINAGQGHGWSAKELASNPNVSEVHTYERSSELIDAITSRLEIPVDVAHKLHWHHVDCLSGPLPDIGPVDHLYMDIWLPAGDPNILADARRMISLMPRKPTVASMWSAEFQTPNPETIIAAELR